MDGQNLFLLSVEEALSHPQFSPEARAVIEKIEERGADISMREVALAFGEDANVFAAKIIRDLVLSEIIRMAEAAEARKGLN